MDGAGRGNECQEKTVGWMVDGEWESAYQGEMERERLTEC
jgi:hypothetical protein